MFITHKNAPTFFKLFKTVLKKNQQHYELCSPRIYKMFTMTRTGSGYYLLLNTGSRRWAQATATPSPSRREIPVEAVVETPCVEP